MAAQLLKLLSAGVPDADLLVRFAATRDDGAFADLVRRHGPAVYRACRHLLGPAAADDAFQATFLVLACRAGTVRKAASVGSWLLGTAGRVARQMRKQERRKAAAAWRAGVRADPLDEVARRLELTELGTALHEELTRLPPALRDPVVLCLVEGQTQDQAAAALGVSVRTLRRQLDRARAVLRARLEGRGVVPAVAAGLVVGVGPAVAMPPELTRRAVDGVSAFLTGRALTPAAVVAKGVAGSMVKLKASAAVATAATVLIGLGVGLGGDGPSRPHPPGEPRPVIDRPAPGGGVVRESGKADPEARPFPSRKVVLPIKLPPGQETAVRVVQLYVSRDAGKTWEQAGAVPPEKDRFEYDAPVDGVYWFSPNVVFKDGAPGAAVRLQPALKLLIDTVPPAVRVTAAERTGQSVLVRWAVEEANPGAGLTRVQVRPVSAATGWTDVALPAGGERAVQFPVDTDGAVVVRVWAADAAGNEGWSAEVVASEASPPVDAKVVIRDLASRFTAAARARDKAGLERLLRSDYRGYKLPIRDMGTKDELGRAETVALWTAPDRTYRGLEYKTKAVHLYGTTAVETGSLSVVVGWKRSAAENILREVDYVRVWLKDEAGWRVAHESP